MKKEPLVKKTPTVEVAWEDLRALLFWAGVGVSDSKGGSYQKDIEEIIRSYAEYIGFNSFFEKPVFKKKEKRKIKRSEKIIK